LDFLKYHGLEEKYYAKKIFDEHDVRFIWGRRCLYERALSLTKAQKTFENKLRSLLNWVYMNVNSSCSGDFDESIGVMPETLMMRGFGLCDRTAVLFVELCRQLDIPALLYVFRNEDGSSPHTVVAIFHKGKWFIADTYHGILYRNAQGKLLGLKKIQDQPMLLKHYDMFKDEKFLKAFLRGSFHWVFDPRALTLRMQRKNRGLQDKMKIRVSQDFSRETKFFSDRIPEGKKLYHWYHSIDFLKKWWNPELRNTLITLNRASSAGALEARAAQLSGNVKRALGIYESIENPPRLAWFYEGQCYYELRQFSNARLLFEKVLETRHLKRLWQICHVYLALIAEKEGAEKEAFKHWKHAPEHEYVRLALRKY
jgi:tetratricopeptide (TPR) repeat protein